VWFIQAGMAVDADHEFLVTKMGLLAQQRSVIYLKKEIRENKSQGLFVSKVPLHYEIVLIK
jgi:hypothetical protein